MDQSNHARVRRPVAEHAREPKTSTECPVIVLLFLILLPCTIACSTKKESSAGASSAKFEQYYVQGQQLYLKHCSNCHQHNGTGLGLLYPPLNKSDYLQDNFEEVVCILRYGKKGEIIVNGKSFNKEMPGIPSLTDLEIAEIVTFVYNSWNNERGIIDVTETTKVLNACEPGQ